MSRSRNTRTRSSATKRKIRIKSKIKTVEHVDASASAKVLINNTHNGTAEVYTKEFAMLGLSKIAPSPTEDSAKITVSFDLSSKHYGNGAGIVCSVTLNCRQDEQSIKLGYDLARAICETEGEEALRRAQDTFNRVVSES
jgi:hypothetical protein